MASETRIVQLLDRISHVLMSEKFNDASSVFVNVSEAHITCLAHVILQILPRSCWRKTWDTNTIVRTASSWSITFLVGVASSITPTKRWTSTSSWKFNSQFVSKRKKIFVIDGKQKCRMREAKFILKFTHRNHNYFGLWLHQTHHVDLRIQQKQMVVLKK